MKEPKSGTEPEGTGSLTGLRLRKVPIGPDPDQFVVFAEDTEPNTPNVGVVVPEPVGIGERPSLTGLRLQKVPIGPDPDQFVVFAEDTESTTANVGVVVPEPVGIGEIIDVVSHAMEVFGGDRTKALRWFRTPIPSLNDETPEEMLQREGGIEQVQEVLGRIEHGVW